MDQQKSNEAGPICQEEIEKRCCKKDSRTEGFMMQQTMLRVKDPLASVEFYTKVLGMILLKRLDVPSMKFTIFFMGYEDIKNVPSDEKQRSVWALSRPATIELTHNWGTENDLEQNTIMEIRIQKDLVTLGSQYPTCTMLANASMNWV